MTVAKHGQVDPGTIWFAAYTSKICHPVHCVLRMPFREEVDSPCPYPLDDHEVCRSYPRPGSRCECGAYVFRLIDDPANAPRFCFHGGDSPAYYHGRIDGTGNCITDAGAAERCVHGGKNTLCTCGAFVFHSVNGCLSVLHVADATQAIFS